MKKSKIATIALCAALALSMTACASTATETEETVAETEVEETVAETSAVETTVAETTVAETEASETEAAAPVEVNIDEELVGEWSADIEGTAFVYAFNEDGTGSMTVSEEGEEMEIPFTYNIPEEGTLTLTVEFAGETDSEEASYTIDGDTLTIDDGTDSIEFTRN